MLTGGIIIVPAKLILASLLADFVFQPAALVSWKKQQFSGLTVHTLIYALVSIGVGIGTWTASYLWLVLALSILHLLIDWGKVRVDRVFTGGYWPVAIFLVDQALHLASILALSNLFGFLPVAHVVDRAASVWNDVRYIYLSAVYVAALFGGSVLVRLITQIFHVAGGGGVEAREAEGAGAYIGVVARAAIATLVAFGQYSAVGLVLAAKSIARYKRMEEQKEFGEYYLIGTFTSATIAIIAGLVARILF